MPVVSSRSLSTIAITWGTYGLIDPLGSGATLSVRDRTLTTPPLRLSISSRGFATPPLATIQRGLVTSTACSMIALVRTVLVLARSEEHTSELQSLMRISHAV